MTFLLITSIIKAFFSGFIDYIINNYYTLDFIIMFLPTTLVICILFGLLFFNVCLPSLKKYFKKGLDVLYNELVIKEDNPKLSSRKNILNISGAAPRVAGIYGFSIGLGVPIMRDLPPPPKRKKEFCLYCGRGFDSCTCLPTQKKKFVKEETVNTEIKDSITGETLDFVQCKCKSFYHKDTYAVYGCPNCNKSLTNKK